MRFNDLDKETQEYIKSLEHQLDVQNELIDAQKEIIDNLKFQNEQHEKYAKRISEMISLCKVLYYIHILGDHKDDTSWKIQNGLKKCCNLWAWGIRISSK